MPGRNNVVIAWVAIVASAVCACGVETYRERDPEPSLEVRVVAEDAATEALARWDDENAMVALESVVIVGAPHIEHVRLLNSAEGRRLLVLALDERGRARLREFSEANPGRRLAIVTGGRVLATPRIQTPLTEGEAYISLPDSELDAAFERLSAE